MTIKNRIKELLGKRKFRIFSDEILIKLNVLRDKVYNKYYYNLVRAKKKVNHETNNIQYLINISKKKARVALEEFVAKREWEFVAVLGFKAITRTQMGAYMAGYHLKRFLVYNKLARDIFFDVEHKSRYHLNLLVVKNPNIGEEFFKQSIANYWYKYHGECWIEKVDPDKEIRYFLKDTYSILNKLNENFFDLDYNLCDPTKDLVRFSDDKDFIQCQTTDQIPEVGVQQTGFSISPFMLCTNPLLVGQYL